MSNGAYLTVGETLPQGTIVLLTRGEYSEFGITGVFRVEEDVVVPGTVSKWNAEKLIVDIALLSTRLAELSYREGWAEGE